MIVNSIAYLVGNTPMFKLDNYCKRHNINADIYAKLECFNPTGSIKDRAVKGMIEDAENRGLLKKGSVIIEGTSGNTGISLSAIGRARGYRVIIVMPDNMSVERRKLIESYGGEVVLTHSSLGMQGAEEKTQELVKKLNGVTLSQFANPANIQSHIKTGEEIYSEQPKIDVFVCGIGTGGTITGAGKYLKSVNPKIKIIGVEPLSSPILSVGKKGAHKIQGIGAGFVPNILDMSICDKIITVSDNDAILTKQEICTTESVFVGISSGAALNACLQLCINKDILDLPQKPTIVTIFPDSGDRYLSIT